MAGRKKKSKKQSAANSKQRKQIVFYVDRNLDSKIVPKALRKAGVSVEIHDDHLAQDAADEEWIELVGRKK